VEKEGTQKSLNKLKIAKVIDEKHEMLKGRMKDEMRRENIGNIKKATAYSAHTYH
jgi:hypothetical protein